jgi:hypothetical protein
MSAFDLSGIAIKNIVRTFNTYGIDGLIAKKRPEQQQLISGELKKRF